MMRRLKPEVASLQHLGPGIRMDCTFKQFKEFENALVESFGETDDEVVKKGPLVTFFGSNDYHHLTLGLARRFRQPFNFVIFDNHPDWCELYGIGLHCGSWFVQQLVQIVSFPYP
jgi:arginase family enzyme